MFYMSRGGLRPPPVGSPRVPLGRGAADLSGSGAVPNLRHTFPKLMSPRLLHVVVWMEIKINDSRSSIDAILYKNLKFKFTCG